MKDLFWRKSIVLLFTVLSFQAFSQDDIIMRNDDVVKGKVEEVGERQIKYRRADNMDGPIYDISKGDVYMIVYANGQRDVINPRGGESPAPQESPSSEVIRTAPPEMPVYEQPLCPTEGYLWTPGYWAYSFIGGYYWVPGVWVSPPHPGYLWTPGYWGYVNGIYGWNGGYWGEHVGFYGGVNYGYGYGGSGFYGGRWEGGAFRYNTAVSRVDVTVIHTTYVDNTVVRTNSMSSRASFNGTGGVRAEPTASERAVMNEPHAKPTQEQQSHIQAARNDKSQYASENHGTPAVSAMNKPNGQHFNSGGQVTQHTPTPINNQAHNNTQPNNGQHSNAPEHSNMPSNNGQHTNTSEHNNAPSYNGQHTNVPEHNNAPSYNGQHTNAPEHTNVPSNNGPHPNYSNNGGQQQHTQPQPQHTQPQHVQPQHTQPRPSPAPKPANNNQHK